MDEQAQFVPLKINTVIPNTKSVQGLSFPLKFAVSLKFRADYLEGHAAELAQDIQLQIFGHAGQLRRTRRIENNLKWKHGVEQFVLRSRTF